MTNLLTRHCAALLLILLASTANAETPASLEKLARDALDHLNVRRAQAGLAPLQRNAVLDRSAAAHASYITRNRTLDTEGHYENADRPGYTGLTPTQRMQAAGYTADMTSENIALTSYPLGALSTDDLIDAPYHRQSQLGPWAEAGVAMSTQPAPQGSVNPEHYIYVINFGGNAVDQGKKSQPFVYPVDGQRDVPADWIANESPNPVPDMNGQRVGYPISLAAAPGEALQISAFSLSDARDVPVEGRLVTTRTDDGKPLGNYAIWVPLKPLAYGTAYLARATGTLNGTAFTTQWRFTTLEAAPLQLSPSAPQIAADEGSTLEVRLSGGTETSFAVSYSGHRFKYSGKAAPKVSFVTASYPAPDLMVLTRSATPCANNITACEVIVKGKDSSGSEVSLALPVN